MGVLTSLLVALLIAVACAAAAPATSLTVVARHLDQPKQMSLAANGDLVVALSGDGKAPASCTDGEEVSCLDHSGAVDEVTTSGQIRVIASGLASVSSGHENPQATGPVQALELGSRTLILFQGSTINTRTGLPVYGSGGSLLNTLVVSSEGGRLTQVLARLGVYEAKYYPDRNAVGTEVEKYGATGIDSDPYSVVAYRGGYAIADAAANDVLWLSPQGKLSVLAVLPTIRERAAAGSFGSAQKKAIEAEAQSVPTSLAVGPDGSLYVGELGGIPGDPGTSSIYRITGHQLSRYASGFSAIESIAFDPEGRLLVLELDKKGLADPGIADNKPASGALIRLSGNHRTTLVSSGLTFPTGMAVTRSGAIYLSVNGVSSDGEIVRVNL